MGATESSTVIDRPDYLSINMGFEIPLFNPVFLKNTAEKLPVIRDGCPHSFWHDSRQNKKIPLAAMQNLEPIMQQVPIMSIPLNREFIQDSPPLVTISKLDDGGDLSEWMIPLQIAFELDAKAGLRYRYCLEQTKDHYIHFLARDKGKIVAVATLYLHDELAGLYNLAVLPEYRKQGIGTALHYARLNEAKERGYEYATLQATPMASKLDGSLGFTTHSELSIFKC